MCSLKHHKNNGIENNHLYYIEPKKAISCLEMHDQTSPFKKVHKFQIARHPKKKEPNSPGRVPISLSRIRRGQKV